MVYKLALCLFVTVEMVSNWFAINFAVLMQLYLVKDLTLDIIFPVFRCFVVHIIDPWAQEMKF